MSTRSSTNLNTPSVSTPGVNRVGSQSGAWSQVGTSGIDKEMQEYYVFRQILISGDLKILKKELIHVLYKMYIKVIRNQIQWLAQRPSEKSKAQESIENILRIRKDFSDYPNYVEELSYLEPILKDLPDIENMKNDKRLNQIFSSSNHLSIP